MGDMLELLRKCKRNDSHLMVPQKKSLLCQWVKGHRKQYNYLKTGKPSNKTEEKVDQLDEIGFEFHGKKQPKFLRRAQNNSIYNKEVDSTIDTQSPNESHEESDGSSTVVVYIFDTINRNDHIQNHKFCFSIKSTYIC